MSVIWLTETDGKREKRRQQFVSSNTNNNKKRRNFIVKPLHSMGHNANRKKTCGRAEGRNGGDGITYLTNK